MTISPYQVQLRLARGLTQQSMVNNRLLMAIRRLIDGEKFDEEAYRDLVAKVDEVSALCEKVLDELEAESKS